MTTEKDPDIDICKLCRQKGRLHCIPYIRQAIDLFRLSLIAIFVGIVTGIGAIAFRGLIGFIHNLLFLGHFSFFYDANRYTPPSPWGVFVILVPVLGALLAS